MSGRATGWVYERSPYTGAAFAVHLAMADVVNDMHENEFWAANATLCAKARISRQACNGVLARMVKDGLLEVLQRPPRGTHAPVRYRFLMPETATVFFDGRARVAVDDMKQGVLMSSEATPHVAVDDTFMSSEATQSLRGNSKERTPTAGDRRSAPSSPRSVPPKAERVNGQRTTGLTPGPKPKVAPAATSSDKDGEAPEQDEARRIADRVSAAGRCATDVRRQAMEYRKFLGVGVEPEVIERAALTLRTITEGTMGVAIQKLETDRTGKLRPAPRYVQPEAAPQLTAEDRAAAARARAKAMADLAARRAEREATLTRTLGDPEEVSA